MISMLHGLNLDHLPRRRHPLTGELLDPLGRRANGQLIWPIMGGSDEAGSEKEGSGDGASGGTDSKDKEGSGNSSSSDEKSSDKGKDEGDKKDKPDANSLEARLAALEDEKERHYSKRKDAEERAEAAEKELKELRDKDLPETEKAQKELKEAQSDNEDLAKQLRQTMLEKAFLEDNTHKWHNPSRALQVLDLSRVEFDKDGTVKGLKEAIEALAKSDPYLIKTEEKTNEDEEDGKPPKSGDQKNNSKKKNSDSTDAARAKLLTKYPGLRR